jgi:drug/metabolite transporter (DMT)-like permease
VTTAAGPKAKAPPLAVIAVLVAVVGLSVGSTLVRETKLPGSVAAFWRLAFGAVAWHIVMLVKKAPLVKSDWKRGWLSGLLFGLNLATFFTGVTRTAIAHAEFIGTLSPLVIIPAAALLHKERVPRIVGALGIVSLAGVGIIVAASDKTSGATLTGDLICVAAVFLWSSYLLRTKTARQGMSTGAFMAVMTTVAAVVVFPIGLSTGQMFDLTPKAVVLMLTMALVSGMIGHGLIAWAQGHNLPVGTISLLQVAQPGLGVTWAYLILHENVKTIQVVGMIVVLISVAAIARVTSQPRSGRGGRELPD